MFGIGSRRGRVISIAMFGLTVSLLAVGCGGNEVKIAVRAKPPPPRLLTTGTTSARLDEAIARISTTQSVDDASRALDDLYRQSDPLADELTTALCTGMQQIGEAEEDATGINWEEFLAGQIEAQQPSIPMPSIVNRVEGLLATWDLAQVHGGLAKTYYQACVAGR